jgi:DNA-binding IclR family transcriptional regulator
MTLPTLRHPIPMTLRIIAYLRKKREPQHYTTIARHLREPYGTTLRTCYRMARDGRLVWRDEGTYALAPSKEERP